MKAITPDDIRWLRYEFPNLIYDVSRRRIEGELDFCASYDKLSGKLMTERDGRNDDIRQSNSFIADVYEVEFHFDSESLGANGWPKVFEVGGRHEGIAQKYGVQGIDLHFYNDDGSCCLGIRLSPDKGLTIVRFLYELVIPFFYRLSYVERHGLRAAGNNLWQDHPHGDEGHRHHKLQMLEIARRRRGRNKPCPCRSGRNYKNCCLGEVKYLGLELEGLSYGGS